MKPSSISDAWMDIPSPVRIAADTICNHAAMWGWRDWQFMGIADRKLVWKLETELQTAQRNEARLREAGKLALQAIRDGKIDDAQLHLEGARL